MSGNSITDELPGVVELNVGGVHYTTSLSTLTKEIESLLGQMFTTSAITKAAKDAKGRYFIDRDGVLFRYILDYLRNDRLVLPENFHEKDRLKAEAEYYNLPGVVKNINIVVPSSNGNKTLVPTPTTSSTTITTNDNTRPTVAVERKPGSILISYRGTFAFGRDGLADVKFRKLSRILVGGRVSLCRETFGDTLNESRDPDRGTSDRYSSRFFLKHSSLEQAFDMLLDAGFHMAGCCGTGTNSSTGENKPGMDSEENRWNHYNEFIFVRE